jgi:hypothetical protein
VQISFGACSVACKTTRRTPAFATITTIGMFAGNQAEEGVWLQAGLHPSAQLVFFDFIRKIML